MKLTSEQIEEIRERVEKFGGSYNGPPRTDLGDMWIQTIYRDIPALLSHIEAIEAERDEADSVGYGKGYQDGYQKGFDDGCEEE